MMSRRERFARARNKYGKAAIGREVVKVEPPKERTTHIIPMVYHSQRDGSRASTLSHPTYTQAILQTAGGAPKKLKLCGKVAVICGVRCLRRWGGTGV